MDITNGGSRSFSPAEKDDLLVVPPIKRRLSPTLKNRCLVLDAGDKTVEIRNEKEVERDSENFQKIPIPPGQDQVTVFVDPDTEQVTTNNETNGQSNVMLAKLYLDKLSRMNKILRTCRQLSTLYITNLRPVSGESSASSMAEHNAISSGPVV